MKPNHDQLGNCILETHTFLQDHSIKGTGPDFELLADVGSFHSFFDRRVRMAKLCTSMLKHEVAYEQIEDLKTSCQPIQA